MLQPPLPNEDPAQLPPNYEDPQRDDPQDDDKGGLPTAVIVVGGSLLAIAAVVGSVLGWKAWRRSRRRARTGVGKALGAWEEILDRARDLGRVPGWGATRREAAEQLDPHFPQADLPRFAGAVDTQVFSSGEPPSYALGARNVHVWDGRWPACPRVLLSIPPGGGHVDPGGCGHDGHG